MEKEKHERQELVLDHTEVGRMWDENAEVWTTLARKGYDVYRDYVNTPAFLTMLPDVSGLTGLDIGCGEGHNTRLIARRGARMTAIDISTKFIAHAHEMEQDEPLGIEYQQANASELPLANASFDFIVSTMCFMDAPDHEKVLQEAFRVLKPGCFLQFSITHPCFQTPKWKWVHDEGGRRIAVECGDYFREPNGEIDEWTFGAAPLEIKQKVRKFRIPRFPRTLSSWLNLLIDTGFILEHLSEPHADEETLKKCPDLQDTCIIAYFLLIRCRKPGKVDFLKSTVS
ncbi:MAG: class I SAM-dependent methyltransferase [Phycisphaerae bacterium]